MMQSFPFSAVVAQDDAKLALLLNAIDPGIGGVLLRGQKGSAKSTLARGLASLLPGDAPFVELPIGATEDRVVGTLDVAAALAGGDVRLLPGLLADADGGVLYVDEVNLLPDHLVDVLLDVAASGVNRVEREGISRAHPSRFLLVGSMNPEEGELRPQLLDRFGLAVDVLGLTDPVARAEAVTRRLAFDADPVELVAKWSVAEHDLAERLVAAAAAAHPVDADLLARITRLCASVGAEGLRADIVIARAAAALAAWEGRDAAGPDDVRRVAPMALAHRRRRSPFEAPGIDDAELEQAMADAADATDAADGVGADPPARPPASPDDPSPVVPIDAGRSSPVAPSGRRSTTDATRGRLVGDREPDGPTSSVAIGATVRAAVAHTTDAPVRVEPGDIREAVREITTGTLVVLAVDASGSMGVERRMAAAKGAVVSLLLDAYQRRDRVALVTFRGDRAEVVLRPTGSVEVARARLAELPTGGRTPLAEGITTALAVAAAPGDGRRPLIVLVTDGRATSGPAGADDPVAAALAAAGDVRRRGVTAVVVDAEDGPTRLGLAASLADAMGARYLTVPELTAGALDAAVRSNYSGRIASQ